MLKRFPRFVLRGGERVLCQCPRFRPFVSTQPSVSRKQRARSSPVSLTNHPSSLFLPWQKHELWFVLSHLLASKHMSAMTANIAVNRTPGKLGLPVPSGLRPPVAGYLER